MGMDAANGAAYGEFGRGYLMPVIYTDKPLPDRIEKDFYPTPRPVIKAAINRFGQRDAQEILDVGAGDEI
jgi:hypothetical protein